MFRIGPFDFELWHLLVFGAVLLLAVWLVRGFLVRIQGTWERIDEDAPPDGAEVPGGPR